MAGGPAQLSWLWNNAALSDITLRLSTTQPSTNAPEGAVAAAAAAAAEGRPQAKAPRRSGRNATAPAAATAVTAAAPPAVAGASTSAAVVPAGAAVLIANAAAAHPGFARSYHCHSTVLASCSAYFKARITGGAGGSNNSGCGGAGGHPGGLTYAHALLPAPAPAAAAAAAAAPGGVASALAVADGLLLVEHVEEGEVDAMEAVLRFCYTGQICSAHGAPEELSVATLLCMMVLADRFDILAGLSACCTELSKRSPACFDLPAINLILGNLPPGVTGHAFTPHLVCVATERLLQLLGDAEAVCDAACNPGGTTLDAQLLQLSLPSLLTLLGSNHLAARSENSVLMLADAWAAGPPGAACSAAQLRQLTAAVRLGQLSHTFAFDVVPLLPWLQTSPAERESLMHFAGLCSDPGRQARLVQNNQVVGPPAWYSAAGSRALSPEMSKAVEVEWVISREQLAGHLRDACGSLPAPLLEGPRRFCSGVCISPTLVTSRQGVPSAWFGLRALVLRSGLAGRSVRCRDVAVCLTLRVAPESPGPLCAVVMCGLPTGCWSRVLAMPLAPLGVCDMAHWEPYLVNDTLKVVCFVTFCY